MMKRKSEALRKQRRRRDRACEFSLKIPKHFSSTRHSFDDGVWSRSKEVLNKYFNLSIDCILTPAKADPNALGRFGSSGIRPTCSGICRSGKSLRAGREDVDGKNREFFVPGPFPAFRLLNKGCDPAINDGMTNRRAARNRTDPQYVKPETINEIAALIGKHRDIPEGFSSAFRQWAPNWMHPSIGNGPVSSLLWEVEIGPYFVSELAKVRGMPGRTKLHAIIKSLGLRKEEIRNEGGKLTPHVVRLIVERLSVGRCDKKSKPKIYPRSR